MKHSFILHSTRGSAGNITATKLFGVTVIRERVREVRNPRTASQQLVRARFSVLSKVAARFRYSNMIGLKAYAAANRMFPYSAFVQLNQHALRGTTPDTLAVIPDQLKLAKGGRMNVEWDNSISQQTPGKLGLTFNDPYASAYPDLHDDKVYAVVYCPDMDAAIVSEPSSRSAGNIRIDIPSSWSGLDVHVYGYDVASDLSMSSDSFYIGHATLN